MHCRINKRTIDELRGKGFMVPEYPDEPGTDAERDIQARYDPNWIGQGLGFAVGINNLFDTDPPECISCGLNNFDPTTYDVPGMFGYVRATLKL